MARHSAFSSDMNTIHSNVSQEVVGRKTEIQLILTALHAGKHILLEGPPGTSKSTLLRAIAKETGMPFYIVEGNIDLTPAKVVGHFNPSGVLKDSYQMEHFEQGPLTKAMLEGGILYIEEFNRMPADVSNVLISPMEEGEISIPRYGSITAVPSFTVIAAQNPYDDVGTVRVSKAFMDRVCLIKMEYQNKEEEQEIVKRRTGVLHPDITGLAVDMVRRTREHSDLKVGASVRGAIDMVDLLTGLLQMDNRIEHNLLLAARMALSNKIWLSEMTEKNTDEIVEEILESLKLQFTDLIKSNEPLPPESLQTDTDDDLPSETGQAKKKAAM